MWIESGLFSNRIQNRIWLSHCIDPGSPNHSLLRRSPKNIFGSFPFYVITLAAEKLPGASNETEMGWIIVTLIASIIELVDWLELWRSEMRQRRRKNHRKLCIIGIAIVFIVMIFDSREEDSFQCKLLLSLLSQAKDFKTSKLKTRLQEFFKPFSIVWSWMCLQIICTPLFIEKA